MPIADRDERRKYHREWMRARRAAYFDGKVCALCPATERLELDHIDPSTKTHHAIWSWSQVRREQELAKCQVLCYSCHRAKSDAALRKPLVHGTMAGYSKKCRCDLCRAANTATKNEYRWRTGRRKRRADKTLAAVQNAPEAIAVE